MGFRLLLQYKCAGHIVLVKPIWEFHTFLNFKESKTRCKNCRSFLYLLNLKRAFYLISVNTSDKHFRQWVSGDDRFSCSFLEMGMEESSSQQLCPVETCLLCSTAHHQGRVMPGCRPARGTSKPWSGARKVVFGKGAVFWETCGGESHLLSWDQEGNQGGGKTVTWDSWSGQVFKGDGKKLRSLGLCPKLWVGGSPKL